MNARTLAGLFTGLCLAMAIAGGVVMLVGAVQAPAKPAERSKRAAEGNVYPLRAPA